MCGRYYVDDTVAEEIKKIVRYTQQKITGRREIHPGEEAPVLLGEGGKTSVRTMRWGFPVRQGRGLIFNARSEGAEEKPLFRESFRLRRCLLPARGFYEWDRDKNRAGYERKDGGVLYLAGIWRPEEQEEFVILTMPANASVQDVHHRMPLIIEERERESWLQDSQEARRLLGRESVEVERVSGCVQQTLPFLE